jgi:hypothetical protein
MDNLAPVDISDEGQEVLPASEDAVPTSDIAVDPTLSEPLTTSVPAEPTADTSTRSPAEQELYDYENNTPAVEEVNPLQFNAADKEDKKLEKLRQIIGENLDVNPDDLKMYSKEKLFLLLPSVSKAVSAREATKSEAIKFDDYLADYINKDYLDGKSPKASKAIASGLLGLESALNSASFGLGPKAFGALKGIFTDVELKDAMQVSEEYSKALDTDHPYASLVGSLGGGFFGMKAIFNATKVLNGAGKILNLSNKVKAAVTGTTAAVGATTGATVGSQTEGVMGLGPLEGAIEGAMVGGLAGAATGGTITSFAAAPAQTAVNMVGAGTLGAIDADRAGSSPIVGGTLGALTVGVPTAVKATKSLADSLKMLSQDATDVSAAKTLSTEMQKLGLVADDASKIIDDLKTGVLPFESANERIQALARSVRTLPEGAGVGADVAEARMKAQPGEALGLIDETTNSTAASTERMIDRAPEALGQRVASKTPDVVPAQKTLASGRDTVLSTLSKEQGIDLTKVKTDAEGFTALKQKFGPEYDEFNTVKVTPDQALDLISDPQIANAVDTLREASGESGIDSDKVFKTLGLTQANDAIIANPQQANEINKAYFKAIAGVLTDKDAAAAKGQLQKKGGQYAKGITAGQAKAMYKDLKTSERELLQLKKLKSSPTDKAQESLLPNAEVSKIEAQLQDIQKGKEKLLGILGDQNTIENLGDVLEVQRYLKDIEAGTISGDETRRKFGLAAKGSLQKIDKYLDENFPEYAVKLKDLKNRYGSAASAVKVARDSMKLGYEGVSGTGSPTVDIERQILKNPDYTESTVKRAARDSFNQIAAAAKKQKQAYQTIETADDLTTIRNAVSPEGSKKAPNLSKVILGTGKESLEIRESLKKAGVNYQSLSENQEYAYVVDSLRTAAKKIKTSTPMAIEDALLPVLNKNEKVLRNKLGDTVFEAFKDSVAAQRKRTEATKIIAGQTGTAPVVENMGLNYSNLLAPKAGPVLLNLSGQLKDIKINPEAKRRLAEAMFSGDVDKVGKVWAITKKAMKNDADMEKLDNLIAATQSIMYYGTREALDNDEVTRLQVSASD